MCFLPKEFWEALLLNWENCKCPDHLPRNSPERCPGCREFENQFTCEYNNTFTPPNTD